jgi:hypothetical protein
VVEMAFGSFFNMIMDGSKSAEPFAGADATELCWSDRHAMTVIQVVRFKSGERKGQIKGVFARKDIAKRVDSNGMSDSQSYEFVFDFSANERWFPIKKNGNFNGIAVGFKSEYYDFSF